MFWLSVAPSALDAAGRKLAEHHEVRFVGATTGQANLIATVAGPSMSAVETALTLRHVKQLTYEQSR
ncbi:Lrp/AsnC ligand binding domain-containing protein [Streptomyces sp. NPDC001668]|uniref:Lrp/AsnC ligand binding domain-containing protein n=1 Tax=unclassified Streptomyces TaxID=2593676 RepID=UPI0036CBD8EC